MNTKNLTKTRTPHTGAGLTARHDGWKIQATDPNGMNIIYGTYRHCAGRHGQVGHIEESGLCVYADDMIVWAAQLNDV